ncbi:ABC transporter ATP-binding protein/permease [Peptostreptococcus anaerobius]|uniref:ABC transporter, ATP-binding protein n=1 Tax=Peptostreptococcus anaerobius 653-L TaxID=596329 RepID=D3MTJ0_9FIRM|nr:ABC transporter ATP-binding protein/permease [Peptostreptococcus anaerobius]EFD04575.1 ABC transporter, ATP-binding protein [Peptostreptococcus anaerobius 653-L]MDK8277675.1 ABC transporter ATP-binding protein/permease [Peptostreptococcus anaerobius]MDU5096147.1 ABC transporter ATP-binding protein/permease [Peptostreptococcus anaerobius]
MIEKSLFEFCGKTKKYIVQAVLINCIKLMANIAFSIAFASLMAYFITGDLIYDFRLVSLVILVSLLFRQLCTRLAARKNHMVVHEVKHSLRRAIYEKVLSMGTLYQEKLTTQEIVHLGVEGVEQLESYFGLYLTQFYYSFVSTFILFLVMLPINIKVALVMLVLSPMIPLFLLLILKIVKNVQKRYWSKYADVGNLFLDSLQGLTTLKVFKADEHRASELDEMAEGFRKQTMKVLSMQLNSIMFIDWMAYGGAAAGIIVALNEYAAGNMGVYEVTLIMLLIADFFVPMRLLTSYFHIAMTGVTASENMLDFLNSPSDIVYGHDEYEENTPIRVKNMTYAYGDGTIALRDIDMVFEPGKMTALVGPSGCGKSTLASVIAGEYLQPQKAVYYGNSEAYSLAKGQINKNIIRITHDGHVFAGTVRSNLLLGDENVTEERMIEVLEQVSLWDIFSKMDGLDTQVLSQGKNLSGGQAQRLSLARALLYDAQVYIFDEATSSIDIESENIIIDIIEKISAFKTVIYISHRLQSVVNSDKIYVMEDGRLVEEGNHKELMENKGLYEHLFSQQEELERYRNHKLSNRGGVSNE